jgi:hypothetical protein
MIYTAPYVMFLMPADPLRGQVGGGKALEIETFFGPVKWHRAVRRVSFGAQRSRDKLTMIEKQCDSAHCNRTATVSSVWRFKM